MIDTSFDAGNALLTATGHGKITHADYQDHLIPAMDLAVQSVGEVKLRYIFADDYEGLSSPAALDDARLGVAHLKDFRRIGVVADQARIRNVVSPFTIFMPAEVRTFAFADLAMAEAWIREA
ncbi:SpoIIAA-like protein [Aliiruegeria haliotis]|uniref:SpoIIAA-like protein n=1 Tax=Aliiruegeria haliotis TaxID=1280846 RepID=A0A2T0RES5_9RHOB|nr:STAS/SEC14 domain-containing protein [Aliiruegeria haliotis]PRY19696.1 SpoIIAA-like protein [Aliiruegeria haliotis]